MHALVDSSNASSKRLAVFTGSGGSLVDFSGSAKRRSDLVLENVAGSFTGVF